MASALENLESQLEMFAENVRQIRIIVSDFQPQGQNVLNQKIQSLVHGLQEIDKLKSQVQDVHVPLEVFEYIDQGRNPQLYTKDCIEKALTKNEQVKGKIDSYRKFKAHLLVELNATFPNEITKYRAIRGDERFYSKHYKTVVEEGGNLLIRVLLSVLVSNKDFFNEFFKDFSHV